MRNLWVIFVAAWMVLVACANEAKQKVEQEPVPAAADAETMDENEEQLPAGPKEIDANFVDANGKVIRLKSLRGKVVVMNFWATWCPPCIREMPSLNKLYLDMKENDKIVFMAIDADQDIRKAAAFMQKNSYQLPLYTVTDSLPPALETRAIPMTVVLDKAGKIAVKHAGMVDFGDKNIKASLLELTKE